MNDAQRVTANAYADVFGGSPAVTRVMDDALAFIGGLDKDHQVGAMKLFTYVLLKRSALRRDTARKGK